MYSWLAGAVVVGVPPRMAEQEAALPSALIRLMAGAVAKGLHSVAMVPLESVAVVILKMEAQVVADSVAIVVLLLLLNFQHTALEGWEHLTPATLPEAVGVGDIPMLL